MVKMKRQRYISSIILFLFFISCVGQAFGQAPAAGITPPKSRAGKLGRAVEAASGNVTMDFKEADITNVLRILSYKGGINIVAGPEVSGLITIRLTDVPWEKALDVILRTYGFAYEREGNIIRVTTIESLKQEELTTEVHSLNYANAEEVSESIKEMLTDRGKIKFDARTNVIIVTDIPTNLYKISLIVEKLDQRTPQVLIEAKIIEVTLSDEERMGIDWQTQISLTGASRPTQLPFIEKWWRDDHRIYPTPLATREVNGEWVERGDSGQFDWIDTYEIISDFPRDPWLPADAARKQFENFKIGAFPMAGAGDFTFGTLDFTQFQAALEFIKERTDTDVLSNPRITTLNNKEATILVGRKMLFPSFAFNEDTGDFVIRGFDDQKDLGVKLTVTPHVNAQGDIVLELNPQIDEFVSVQVLDATRGIVAPIFTTREATAEVMVRNGDTIMMGGMITNTTTDVEDKVPLLGDIPLIGDYFFTSKRQTHARTELIIFITVHLIDEEWPTHLDPNVSRYDMPVPKATEVFMAMPRAEERKNKWWELW